MFWEILLKILLFFALLTKYLNIIFLIAKDGAVFFQLSRNILSE